MPFTLSAASHGGREAEASGDSIRVAEDVPVVAEADICVLGGSCTGAFAAIRAARLGARVVLVEKENHFGGTATVTCTWHSLYDTTHQRQIIAGLTREGCDNLILAGRMLDADREAFGAVRVMVNANQMGEAAGVAAYLAVDGKKPIAMISPDAVRNLLAKGGSIVI